MNSYQVLDFKSLKYKVQRSSKPCGKSLIQEAECEINEILHEINKKEPKNVKDLKSNTPEKKQENEYSQQSNTELRSDESGVIDIQEMAVSSGEKEHDVIGEETGLRSHSVRRTLRQNQ